jgi:hypothetical protein
LNEETCDSLPLVKIDYQQGDANCSGLASCEKNRVKWTREWFYIDEKMAWLDLRALTYEQYLMNVKNRYKSKSALRDSRKADKEGYFCKPFMRRLFLSDIVTINHSKEIRNGNAMTGSYLKSLEEMGGPPNKYIPFRLPVCPVHYMMAWGLFRTEPGYKQGDVVTNEKLLAYAFVRRLGNLAFYSHLIGHGDYLKQGIVYRLHFAVMEWICSRDSAFNQGIEHLIHGDYLAGSDGRILWRKKTCFQPAALVFPR